MAGYQTDPTGDADGINACDITRVDVEVTYNAHPVDDEIILKITLAEAPLMDENHTVRYDYNFLVDTSLSNEPDTTTWSSDVFEYRAHLDCRWVSDEWLNTSYLTAHRYYLTYDGSAKVEGTFYWNPNTDAWQDTIPDIEVGEVIGNTVVWDVTSAIFREQAIGTGYVVQGVANAAYGLIVKDFGPNSGWCDEFDNMCVAPTSNTSTSSLPNIGLIFSIVFLGFIVASINIIHRKK
ncbi:MAG: hypothetical protein EAX90_14820 [Candidatus Heimdallarchaeota archaeon]|nr:hypothetical protein [Candidatus Heimdallarchaeota archaeon]